MVTALLVTSAASLIESAPFLLAGSAGLQDRRYAWLAPYLGCGCGSGPSARSLPAAAAFWIAFNPLVACARLAAAIAIDAVMWRRHTCSHAQTPSLLNLLRTVLPPAILAAAVGLVGPSILYVHAGTPLAFAAGAAIAFVAAPCGVGSCALAVALCAISRPLGCGFLCVCGIADLRTWLRSTSCGSGHDAFAYLVCACACALTAARAGAALVHPKFTVPLWIAAGCCAFLALRHRAASAPHLRLAPIVMLAGTILITPPPEYHATETTLSGAFAGERIDFTGLATQSAHVTTLVRYAITCCRADAAPVVLRLERRLPLIHRWVRARGMLVRTHDGLALRATEINAVTPPADPFVYR